MICGICGSSRVEQKSHLGDKTHTKCEDCGAIDSQIYEWKCREGNTHPVGDLYCDCEEQRRQVEQEAADERD